jgi:hypothetical protein
MVPTWLVLESHDCGGEIHCHQNHRQQKKQTLKSTNDEKERVKYISITIISRA